MTGSEFAGRHLQYEKFYAGASFIIRNHSYRETDWAEFNTLVDKVMSGYDVPGAGKKVAAEEGNALATGAVPPPLEGEGREPTGPREARPDDRLRERGGVNSTFANSP